MRWLRGWRRLAEGITLHYADDSGKERISWPVCGPVRRWEPEGRAGPPGGGHI